MVDDAKVPIKIGKDDAGNEVVMIEKIHFDKLVKRADEWREHLEQLAVLRSISKPGKKLLMDIRGNQFEIQVKT